MIRLLILTICLTYSLAGNSQEAIDASYRAEVKKLLGDLHLSSKKDTPAYVREAYPSGLSKMKYTFRSNMFESFLKDAKYYYKAPFPPTTEKDGLSIVFTKRELALMIDYMKTPTSFTWTQEFVSGPLVDMVTVDTTSRNDPDGYWGHFPNGYIEMSRPLFFRDNTLCLFYWGHPEGMTSGYGTLSIYIKRDGVWKEFQSLYSWDS